ncbi:hypothetical protein C7974DRAFT_200955 [Boeremia exigua]|uniref:uncharacterized protein n=1 Tax=Boeremia exigua TaxID=749465 RepID=UPI001E8D50F2|nr:uncharacterized protein C7974DRAFT_200955 [Boeremia exigua]KAH6625409.1 hypothetical protein C7974DRAFT_200955 [Boeremia exigua]
MSGLEVAGVVLGALPLIISAMEHYANGVNTAKRYWRYKTELRMLILQINTERGILVNTVEQLLTGIVRIEQMTDFVASAGAQAWREAGFDSKLRDRLRGSYEIYVENVRGMEMALRRMMLKLALDPEGKPQFSDPSLFKKEYKRLKFSISKSEYTEQINDLRNFNQALIRLTKQSLELEPTRAVKNRTCPNFKGLRSYAKELYEALRSGFNCTSGCLEEHAVKLRLEKRSQLFKSDEDIPEKTQFRVVFTHTSPTQWKEADIRCILDKTLSLPLSPNVSISRMTQKQVRFGQIDTAAQSYSNQSITMTTVHRPVTLVQDTRPEHIQNLCVAFRKLQQPQKDICMGYMLDTMQRKHGIYPLSGLYNCGQQQWVAFSLHQILTDQANTHKRLTQHDKLRIALDLSSSILQLYKTPWLDEHWGDNDVYFLQKPGAKPLAIYEHPYVYRQLAPTLSNTNTQAAQTKYRIVRNQTLYSLGILLIELWYGKAIEQLQTPADLVCDGTPGVSWCTAERLVDNELEFEAGKRYADAVRRCIRCDFDRSDMSLDSESFQQAVFEGVVVPLETTLQQFSGQLS